MIVIGNDTEEIKTLKEYLSKEFEMKDMGKYTFDLLHESGMSACQPVDTPIEEGLKLCIEKSQVLMDRGR